MTESDIEKFKKTLQNKLNILGPKKIKGLTKLEVIDVGFEKSTWEGHPGSMDITIDPEFDFKDGYDTTWHSRTQSFTRNLASALLQNETRIYVFFR